MLYTSVDITTRSILLQKQLSLHWYTQFLKYVCDAIQELSFDTLKVVNSAVLPVIPNGNYVNLPDDFVDSTLVGIPRGQFIQPVVQRDGISRLPNYNTTGQIIDYGIPDKAVDFPFWPGFFMFQTISDLGENLGRLYGYNMGYSSNGYKIIRERGIIQLDERFPSKCLALEYISNGQSADSATRTDPQAQKCIEAFADHQWELHKIKGNSAMIQIKKDEFKRQWRMLRARLSDATVYDIRQALYRSYSLTIKN